MSERGKLGTPEGWMNAQRRQAEQSARDDYLIDRLIARLRAEHLLVPPEVPKLTPEMIEEVRTSIKNSLFPANVIGVIWNAAWRAMLSQQEKGDKA